MAINNWPVSERPRERLLQLGARQLTDAELLAIFLRTGTKGTSAVDLARQLLCRFGGLNQLIQAEEKEFCSLPGLGPTKYAQLQAVQELSVRLQQEQIQFGERLPSSQQVGQYIHDRIGHYQQEVFCVMLLDNQHRLIEFAELFFGTINSATVHPREVVKKGLSCNAAAAILAHNHPSGTAEPSPADRLLTDNLVDALRLVDIRIIDHLVIGRGKWVSFADRGWL
jgi:DNA repair protein RadC